MDWKPQPTRGSSTLTLLSMCLAQDSAPCAAVGTLTAWPFCCLVLTLGAWIGFIVIYIIPTPHFLRTASIRLDSVHSRNTFHWKIVLLHSINKLKLADVTLTNNCVLSMLFESTCYFHCATEAACYDSMKDGSFILNPRMKRHRDYSYN